MSSRAPLLLLALTLPSALAAQTIDYDAGEHQYAETLAPERPDDAVTWSVPTVVEVLPAERVIQARRSPAAIFVTRPVVQGATVVAAPSFEPSAALPAPLVYTTSTPASSAAGAASRVIYPVGAGRPAALPGAYTVQLAGALPPGAQIVAFERESWLSDCRARLSGYAPEDRAAVMAAVAGAPGAYNCESYLASYMDRAANGTLAFQPSYGQPYMLLTTTAPQQ